MLSKVYTLCKVFYLGENYNGSQRQPKLRTIEGELLNVLHQKQYISDDLYKNQIIHSAGRTDTGVHARAMVYGFYNQREVFYPMEVNSVLANDILIWSSCNVELVDDLPSVHPRYQALCRQYKYFLVDSQQQLQFPLVQSTIEKLSGTHDFRNFSKLEMKTNTIRTVDSIAVEKNEYIWVFNFVAKSFLWNQIRKMMRVITHIGKKEWSMEVLDSLFDPKDRTVASKLEPMPPNGLILWDIFYPSYLEFRNCNRSVEKLKSLLMSWRDSLYTQESLLQRLHNSF